MHINGMIITKEFISQWNSKCLRGVVGRAHIHIGYMFLKSYEEIVVRNPKSNIVFIIYSLVSCLCVILQLIHISHLSKWLGFNPPRREDHLLRLRYDA